ncbi:DUF6065 family protein [Sinorhizobium mexicanum]|uniref:Uncharacterized protein n=1 Tax=Sinorhizobium mexicanum TaxID=375549 RepID=A0A859QS98_9HYPH|nr:DUF6065 family protein [Sinorhizobium mexicanum]MBP1887444.1 hypothetical protein [Sinorhizobium mexicanum]QLL62339.1 hypothetical protein FKV68_13275 [Sinorhizobium mexicanum]
MKELTAYVLEGHEVRIRPAPLERRWMDRTNQRFAYRCLPLNIANTHGWEILCSTAFSAIWDGRYALDAVRIKTRSDKPPLAVSHFGEGVLTFHVPCIFKTEPGFDLYVTGPINNPKDGIAPLTGIVEADWSPYTFTMNWIFTRPAHRVHFAADEPFCHIFPVKRGALETVTPTLRPLAEAPEIEREYRLWSESRYNFNRDLANPESSAAQARWQKSYFRGELPSGESGPGDHRSRLRLRPFK